MSPLSQMWCLFETGGLHGRVATGFRDQCRSAAPGFGGQARFPRERRQSSAAAVVDALVIGPRRAEKIGRLLRERLMRRRVDASWARNECSTDGWCSASGAAAVAARSSATVVGAIAGGAAEGALVTGGGIGAALDGGGGGAVGGGDRDGSVGQHRWGRTVLGTRPLSPKLRHRPRRLRARQQ